MSVKNFSFSAAVDVQQTHCTVAGTVSSGDVFTITCGSKSISYTAAPGDVAGNVSTGLISIHAALDWSVYPEFSEMAASPGTTGQIVFLASTAGVAFSVSTSTTSGGATFVTTTATANKGPADFGDPANWGGTLPTNGDDVYIANSSKNILYNLDALSGVSLNSLNIAGTFLGRIGLPLNNDGTYTKPVVRSLSSITPYNEYRQLYLKVGGATTVNIGTGAGNGSGCVRVDVQSTTATFNLAKTAVSLDPTGLEACLLKGTSSSNVLNYSAGTVGIAVLPGETSTLSKLNIITNATATVLNPQNSGSVRTGPSCTVTTLTQSGGSSSLYGNITTINQIGGTTNLYGTSAVTTANIDAGVLVDQSSGTITTLNVSGAGLAKIDFTQNNVSRTVTNCNCYKGSTILDTLRTVTWTNPIALNFCKLADCAFDFGTNITIKPVAV